MKNLTQSLVTTGIAELDDILGGGLTANRVYLLQGTPGCGKTTLSLQFLMEGARQGEKVLYVTLSETRNELVASARSHGWGLKGIDICELVVHESELQSDNQYTMYHPSEVELGATTKSIIDQIIAIRPKRVIIDSLSEIKLLAQNSLRYRRQVLALKNFFIGRDCTTLFLDDKSANSGEDNQLESIAHGVISLEQLSSQFGAERRRLRIIKLRGQKYRGGFHDFIIAKGGLNVFPRLVAADHKKTNKVQQLQSGIPELDAMLNGGIEYGTSMLLLGPAGAGKSSLSMQYAVAAAARGERAAVFNFDERIEIVMERARGLKQNVEKFIKKDLISMQSIDPAELSPGEFIHAVRKAAEGTDGKEGARVIVIDSLNGYLNAMPEEQFLNAQLHELLTYLGHLNVVTILIVAQHGLLGNAMQSPLDTSYLADSVILFRYFEALGEVRQTISVVKKRTGKHERSIREFKLDNGLLVGKVLTEFQGVLSGVPMFVGQNKDLMIRK